MTSPLATEPLSPVKRALLVIEELQARLDAAEQARTEPIAIIGVGCRFPGGADGPEAFWRLLSEGRDAIVEVPAERWSLDDWYDPDPGALGKMSSRFGGFVPTMGDFDAPFFGISPREAAALDPQQRLLLEVGWEAFEDAGQPVEALVGSRTGVFVGIGNADYALQQALGGPMDAYASTGSNLGVAAGRVAYALGLQGPVFALDAGCASSLVAVHLACQSLRNGEADLALAGGVNALLSPHSYVAISQLQALAPDGRCKTFDASADGFVRGEGCGLVVLKRLSRALADRDPIRALVCGSAINHGGRATGLTAPNVRAQEAVLRAALASAAVAPERVCLVETHGTGTALGDPIEFEALARVFGPGRSAQRPLVLGAVKTNVGHLEAAAGSAGLIKAAECLRRGEVPANLHLHTPNPHLPLAALSAILPAERMPLPPAPDGRRMAGVSAFGVGGTNAHVVLAEPPPPAPSAAPPPAGVARLLPLSARSPTALRALARAWGEHARGLDDGALADACYTAAARRSHHEHRVVLTFRTRDELNERLDAFAQDRPVPGLVAGASAEGWRGLAFVFPGQGSQWPGMGRSLLANEPVFRDTIERCDHALRPFVNGWTLLGQLTGREPSRLAELDVVQPTLFAMQVALAELWRAWGVTPDVVIGHSMGEVAAAHVAGALRLDDAARIIGLRSRLLARVSGRGAMLTAELTHAEAREALRGLEDRASVAASNGPRSTVLAGEHGALQKVAAALEARGLFCRFVRVDVASHSPQVDPLLAELRELLAPVRPCAGTVPLCSTVTAEFVDGASLDADYWCRNLREPVRFDEAIEGLNTKGYELFVEVSPHPVLLPSIRQGLEHRGRPGEALPSARRDEDERSVLLESLGSLYVAGRPLDWRRLYPEGRCVSLPVYPWQHEPYGLGGSERSRRLTPATSDDDGLYEVAWRARPRPARAAVDEAPGRWLIVSDRGDVGPALARRLEALGARVDLARPVEGDAAPGAALAVRPEMPDDLERLARELGPGGLRGVVLLGALDAPANEVGSVAALDDAQRRGCLGVAAIVRGLLAGSGPPPRVWLATRGAQAVVRGEAPAVAQAPLWGLGRTLAAEHPELWGGLVDLDPAADADAAALDLVAELFGADGEDQVALRAGGRYAARLIPLPAIETPTLPPLRDDGQYLVTGGLSGIGLQVARWLADRGARHLVLAARTPLPPRERWGELASGSREAEASAVVRELERRGVRVEVVSLDAGDESAVRALARRSRTSGLPLRGVMHAAGTSELRPLAELDAPSLAAVQRAKVAGGLWLDAALEGEPLDFFVLFSSGSALLGSPLLAGYASANAFLDALAHWRRARGRPALTVNWGFWSEVGIAARRGAEAGRDYAPRGMETISVRRGLAMLGALMARDAVQAVAMPTRWHEWRAHYPSASRAPFFAEVLSARGATAAPEGAPSAPTQPGSTQGLSREALRAAAPLDRPAKLLEQLRAVVAEVLRLPPSRPLHDDEPLNRAGIDSLMAIELKRRVQRGLGVTLPAAALLKGPSLAELGARIAELLQAEELIAAVRAEPAAIAADESGREDVTL
ncbi:MAG: type I polyketide synthase [Polyangiaceae bacterium]|nr:type I polyketide synthase [Polyangiaceae bacterium]